MDLRLIHYSGSGPRGVGPQFSFQPDASLSHRTRSLEAGGRDRGREEIGVQLDPKIRPSGREMELDHFEPTKEFLAGF